MHLLSPLPPEVLLSLTPANAGAQPLASPYLFPALVANGTLTATFTTTTGSYTLRPNGDTGTIGLSNNGCNNNNHWDCVDEASADTTTYVYRDSSNAGEDQYDISYPSPAPSGVIDSVIVNANCRYSGSSGTGYATPLLDIVAIATKYGSQVTLTGSYTTYAYSWTQNPWTSTAWQWSELTNLQACCIFLILITLIIILMFFSLSFCCKNTTPSAEYSIIPSFE